MPRLIIHTSNRLHTRARRLSLSMARFHVHLLKRATCVSMSSMFFLANIFLVLFTPRLDTADSVTRQLSSWPTSKDGDTPNHLRFPQKAHFPQFTNTTTAIVITVHGALKYLASCLETWSECTSDSYVYLVDDCDLATERVELQKLASRYTNVTIIPNTKGASIGYTKAVNAGLRAAFDAGFTYIAQLNSDTLLSPHWLPPLRSVLDRVASAGAVGPLSNAATWQSIPEITTSSGSWSTNPLPPNMSPEMMARLVFLLSDNAPIQLPILNGFLILYHRDVFGDTGFMDDVLSPRGYGEENDFAFRMRSHNYTLWVSPTSYVYHFKSKSFKKEEYQMQVTETKRKMKERYGAQLAAAVAELRDNVALAKVRARVQQSLHNSIPSLDRPFSVLFVLNCMSTSKPFMLHGGWISLVQEALGLHHNGAYVKIAVPAGYVSNFEAAFADAKEARLFWGFSGKSPEAVANELASQARVYDFVIATHSSTADTVLRILRFWPNAAPAYYVQDIETEFKDGIARETAMTSYRDFARGAFVFVKTSWLRDRIATEFNVTAYLIKPTVDTQLFHPGVQTFSGKLTVCAMVRPSTPRRNPKETLQVLSWAAKTLNMNAVAYGASETKILEYLDREGADGIDLRSINVLGILDREQMRDANRNVCELFLDLSSWQAFGRSGIEAMASGVVPILPRNGGTNAYALAGENAFLIDTSHLDDVKRLLNEIAQGQHDLSRMRAAALRTAQGFSIERATRTTFNIFKDYVERWRAHRATLVSHPGNS